MAGINFSGIASGIDGNAIIQSVVDAKNITKIPYENKIKTNEAESAAYQKIRDLLGVLNSKSSVFQTFKGTAVSKSVTSSNEDYAVAAVSGNAAVGTVNFKVNQLASSGRITFDSTFADTASPIAPGLSGDSDFKITVGSGSNVQEFGATVNSTTTLNDLIEELNTNSNNRYSASAINIGTIANPQYKLMISGLETGVEKGTMTVAIGQAVRDQGIFTSSQVKQAGDSIVEVEGIGLVQRGSNTINDIFPGLSIELKQASTAPVILKISNDIDKTTEKVSEFIAAYNELRKYISDNDKITRQEDSTGSSNSYGVLAKTKIDDQLLSSLKNTLQSTKLDVTDSTVNILADLGIKTNRDTGDLELDQDVLKNALTKDPQGSGRLLSKLGDNLSSTNGVIYNFTKFQGLIDGSERANLDENEFINSKLARIEANIERQKEYLTKLFATLETTIGKLQANSASLASLSAQS